ncbi:hypothetical protein EJB05_28036 [Eragrostis curvula]|uniref:Uncharacterized protein n=1 Tax=Eragrostis curvula TaxID=38414 RepID=A0A5J9UQP5_9POAL|nr:hypothetical protein EJB05_28036 [Eragrostis curvula]
MMADPASFCLQDRNGSSRCVASEQLVKIEEEDLVRLGLEGKLYNATGGVVDLVMREFVEGVIENRKPASTLYLSKLDLGRVDYCGRVVHMFHRAYTKKTIQPLMSGGD